MDDGFQLPHEVAVAWGVADRSRRGRKPRLSLDAITSAAVAVADTEGLAAVSMSRVAADLGFSPMSLYRYVRSKDELVQLMVDAALGDPPALDARDGWRAGLSAWTRGVLDSYRRHPWIADVPVTGPPVLPNNLAWMDAALRVLELTPLAAEHRVQTIALLSGYARNEAVLDAQLVRGRAQAGVSAAEAETAYTATMDAVVTAERLPALRALVDGFLLAELPDPPLTDSDYGALDDAWLAFGLDRILDGLEVFIAGREAAVDG